MRRGVWRALSIRDGGCQFPGCSESRYVEGHHIKHWADYDGIDVNTTVTKWAGEQMDLSMAVAGASNS